MTNVLSVLAFISSSLVFVANINEAYIFVSYPLLSGVLDLTFSVVLDPISMGSTCLVLFISGCVFLFSWVYISQDPNENRFILLLLGFVLSMVILLISCSIPLLLVGWDGLGVTSFLLIVYYDSNSNNRSGIITFCVNRLGDAILISSSVFFLIEGSIFISGYHLSLYLGVSYMLISMTNSAQYPFSIWLPLAMDAPTPVSALVHSSTLVTAGLFLMARMLPESYNPYLLFIGGTTLCVGGFCAMFSSDLKKLIANSTLSNLGLIGFILALSNNSLIVFHLYTHALFKAGLFIAAGAILIGSFGVQDSRCLYGGGNSSPLLASMVSCFIVSSIGLFFLSTFFSNHQISLIAQILPVNILSVITICLGIIFTSVYSIRFCYVILGSNTNMSLSSSAPVTVLFSIGLLGFASIWYGNFASSCLLSSVCCYEAPTGVLAIIGILIFMAWSNNLSSNASKSIMQIDSVMDSLSNTSSSINSLRITDMGYGSVDTLGVMEGIRSLSSIIVGTMSPSRVNLSLSFISLCSVLLFL